MQDSWLKSVCCTILEMFLSLVVSVVIRSIIKAIGPPTHS